MKVIQIADLHLGKLFHKTNIIRDQEYMLQQILSIMEQQQANLIIAGDVFDSANPSLEAQELFLRTMISVKKLCSTYNKRCWIIVGNHDSNRRLLLWREFLLPEIDIIDDTRWVEWEGTKLFLMSFIKPVSAQMHFNLFFDSYKEAFKAYIKDLPDKEHTILVAHQTFEGCTTGSSETMSFFDDAVPISEVSEFALVLAGHIHKRQTIQNITYCGSLLPYAFGDAFSNSVRVWNVDTTKDNFEIGYEDVAVNCLHNLKIIRGDLKHCLSIPDSNDYIKIELIEENVDLDIAMNQLKSHFTYLMNVSTKITDTWEADLNKPVEKFSTVEEAVDSFCNQIEIPLFETSQMNLIKECIYEITKTED
jgi:exonuclease SbcD